MTLKLLTSDDFEVDCIFDLGNRWIVIDREDYCKDDEYIGFFDQEEYFDILTFQVVKMTRNKVMITIEVFPEEDSDSSSDGDSDSSLPDMELPPPLDDEEETSEGSEEDECTSSSSEDSYWDELASFQ